MSQTRSKEAIQAAANKLKEKLNPSSPTPSKIEEPIEQKPVPQPVLELMKITDQLQQVLETYQTQTVPVPRRQLKHLGQVKLEDDDLMMVVDIRVFSAEKYVTGVESVVNLSGVLSQSMLPRSHSHIESIFMTTVKIPLLMRIKNLLQELVRNDNALPTADSSIMGEDMARSDDLDDEDDDSIDADFDKDDNDE